MTNSGKILSVALIIFLTALAGCKKDNAGMQDMQAGREEVVVVANRAGASISFINARNDELIKTLSIPGSEPMYVVFVPHHDKLYVGDRLQKKIHVVNPGTMQVEQSIGVGNGVFHMWADAAGRALWVVNDADHTVSVIDLATNTVVKTIQVGIKPHDVFLSEDGTRAYVSVFTADASVADSVFLYRTSDYSKVATKGVGKEPHLFAYGNKLQVACQSGVLHTLNAGLGEMSTLALSGAHGIYKSPGSRFLYLSDITGNRLYAVNESHNTLSKTITEMPATPHNIAVSDNGRKMYVSHSGNTATSVVVYNLDPVSGNMQSSKIISTAVNPFGLTYYRR